MVLCPECGCEIDVDEDELEEGGVVTCDECEQDFEVVGVDPIELAPILEEDEDEEPDEEEDEDDEEDSDY